ncbi:hypothetical protein Tco_0671193, partial [Tanacetum coccineum]
AIPTDPHHTPTFIQPSTQPQKTQKPRKLKRKDTQRAATTASSLEAEQDSGNINKTQSKATPNESSFQGTISCSGPKCQETMGDTIAQTRFDNVSKHSNDSLLVRGNTLQSDEDRLKLNELTALCTTLQNRVLDLEKTKTSQHNEIGSLKRMVKKFEKKNRSSTHRLKRLYKVGLTARVESSNDEESLGEDASKQGRIDAIDADEEVTLVSVHDMNVSAGEEVVEEVVEVIIIAKLIIYAAQVSVAGDIVSATSVATTVSTATTTTATINTVDDITLAQALEEMISTKPKKKWIVIQELDESTATISSQLSLQQSRDKDEFNEEERLAREKAEKEEEANIALIETWDDIQAKIDVDHQLAERMQAQEQEVVGERQKKREGTELVQKSIKKQKVDDDKETSELKQRIEIILDEQEIAIDAIPLVVKSPSIVGRKIHKEGRKSYYKIIRVDGKSQMYMIFSHMLKSFNREDLKDLYKLVKAKYESTRPVEDLDLILCGDLKTIFEPHVEDKICLGVDLEPDEWIKDIRFSKHMMGNRNLFSSYKAYNRCNVIFGSNLRGNIIGKGQICDNKCRVTFSEHDSEITKDGKEIRSHNLRLFHSLASKELVRNLPKLKFDQHFCDACKIGKQAHASHKAKNIVSTTRCLELLHMDLFGPSAVRSYGGNRYTLVIVDDYSSKPTSSLNKTVLGENQRKLINCLQSLMKIDWKSSPTKDITLGGIDISVICELLRLKEKKKVEEARIKVTERKNKKET